MKKFFYGGKTALGNELPPCRTGTPLWERLWVYYMFEGGTLSEYFYDLLVRLHGRDKALKHLEKLRRDEAEDIEDAIKTSKQEEP